MPFSSEFTADGVGVLRFGTGLLSPRGRIDRRCADLEDALVPLTPMGEVHEAHEAHRHGEADRDDDSTMPAAIPPKAMLATSIPNG
jgi:hypothetical protein